MTTAQSEPKTPAYLDPDFANKGVRIINMPEHKEGTGAGVDTDANNNIVYVANSDRKFVIGRIRRNGEDDLTFGFEGQHQDMFADGYASTATGVSVQPDSGRILLSGAHTGKLGINPAFALFNSSGKYVTDFGDEGKVVVALPLEAQASLQEDNSSYTTASTTCHPVMNADGTILFVFGGYIIRLNSDGTTDHSFNHGIGYIRLTHPEYRLTTTCLLQLDSDRILVGGIARINGKHFSMMACYLMTGELDTRYADNGYFFLTSWGYHNAVFKLVAVNTNSVIAIGRSDSVPEKGLLFRLDENGNPEPYFNQGKPVQTPDDATPSFSWNGGTVDQNGDVLVISDTMTSSGDVNDIAIAKFFPVGIPDTSFAPRTGWIRAQASHAADITEDSRGRIAVMANTAFTENLQRPKVMVFIA